MAAAQLTLIDTNQPWKLDRHTVEVGRAGIARARAALAAASTTTTEDDPTETGVVTHQIAA